MPFMVDDRFHNHPKVLRLRRESCYPSCIAMWTLAGSWASGMEGYRDTGVVPDDVLATLGIPDWQCARDAMIAVGLWDAVLIDRQGVRDMSGTVPDDVPGTVPPSAGIRFHEWGLWNTADGVALRKQYERERKQRWRSKQKTGRSEPVSSAVPDNVPDSPDDVPGTVPRGRARGGGGGGGGGDVSNPPLLAKAVGPVRDESRTEPATRTKPRTKLDPSWWPPVAAADAMAAELSVDRSQLAGWHKSFVDYWVGEGKPKADWVATWRNWMRREAANAGGRKNGRPLPMSDAERRLWELS